MVDVLTPEQRRYNMSRIRGGNTKPELLIRKALHARGFRYRLHRRDLPGRPDVVLPRYHAVIFIHGCFWHGHSCHLVKRPATREAFWREKLGNNAARDKDVIASLQAAGWKAAIIWECALRGTSKQPLDVVMRRIVRYIKGRTATVLEIAGAEELLSRRHD